MPRFLVYAGMSGGFGGATYQMTETYATIEEALENARNIAVETYQSYEGFHGILSYEDCRNALLEEVEDGDITEEDIEDYYLEEIESWITYYVTEIYEIPSRDKE